MDIIAQELFKVKHLPALIVVTTNSTLKNNGALVMGRGAALDLKNKVPDIDLEIGERILDFSGVKHELYEECVYNFLEIRSPYRHGKAGIGIFQVKKNFKASADLSLIATSCIGLKRWMTLNPKVRVQMNFPGIGAGHLEYDNVLPVLRSFFKDVNLTFCTKFQTHLPDGASSAN
jgi:hypothetical protein